MPSLFISYLKLAFLCSPLLFLTHEALAQSSFCAINNTETEAPLLQKFKENFYHEIKVHYDKLVEKKSISESRAIDAIKKYENPEIKVCPNPHNFSQKIVYIEYEDNWWGSLYFTLVKDGKILKWMKIETYGATTDYVRWNNDGSFFYKDSTHMGTRTHNTCFVRNHSVKCEAPQVQQ